MNRQSTGTWNIRVYLGPSMPLDEARAILDADYRPPVTARDLPLACAAGVDAVVIIDGAFIHANTASPIQIARCLQRGMRVYGGASAGALRAVDCAALGMVGVGGIYELYASGFEDESAVAVAFDPESGRALSLPLVNLMYACDVAVAEAVITRVDADQLLDIGRGVYFAHRSYGALLSEATDRIPSEVLQKFDTFRRSRGESLNWKRSDARRCLERVAGDATRHAEWMGSTSPPSVCEDRGTLARAMRKMAWERDGQAAVDLLEVVRRLPDEPAVAMQLDLALQDMALHAGPMPPAARYAWSELQDLSGDHLTAAELRATSRHGRAE